MPASKTERILTALASRLRKLSKVNDVAPGSRTRR